MSEEKAEDASAAFTRVREVAEFVRAAQERISTLEAGIRTMRESTRRDLQLAQDRVDDAERRCREAESARRVDQLDHGGASRGPVLGPAPPVCRDPAISAPGTAS